MQPRSHTSTPSPSKKRFLLAARNQPCSPWPPPTTDSDHPGRYQDRHLVPIGRYLVPIGDRRAMPWCTRDESSCTQNQTPSYVFTPPRKMNGEFATKANTPATTSLLSVSGFLDACDDDASMARKVSKNTRGGEGRGANEACLCWVDGSKPNY